MKKRRPQEGWVGESGAQLGKTSCGPGPGAKSPRFGAGCSPPGTQPHTAPPRGNAACQEAPRAAVPAPRPQVFLEPWAVFLGSPVTVRASHWCPHGLQAAGRVPAACPTACLETWGCPPGPHRRPPAAPGQSLSVLLPSPALIRTRWPALLLPPSVQATNLLWGDGSSLPLGIPSPPLKQVICGALVETANETSAPHPETDMSVGGGGGNRPQEQRVSDARLSECRRRCGSRG